MKLAIILTNDWELFGNGTGDYYKNQKEPLEELLNAIHEHGFKLSIFAEVVQQFRLFSTSGENKKDLEILRDWEETIKHLRSTGHDVQLHIHPQLLKDQQNNPRSWSIADLKDDEMLEVISRGKTYLESVLREVDPNYECIAFRAGAYAIQPSKEVIRNLHKAGIQSDTSVTKGLASSFFNYRNAYSSYFPWFCNTDVIKKSDTEESILEIPVFSVSKIDFPVFRVKFPKLYYALLHSIRLTAEEMQWMFEKRNGKNGYSIREKYLAQASQSVFKLFFYKMLQPFSLQFDYDKIPARVLVGYLKKRMKKWSAKEFEAYEHCYLPVVFIGHAKEHHGNYNLNVLMKMLKQEFPDHIEPMTYSEFYAHFMTNYKDYELLGNRLKANKLLF